MFRLGLICFLIAFWMGVDTSSAQSSYQVLSQLKASIMGADAVGLAEQTMNSVEIAQFGEGRYYSRGQATLLLKGFFKEYPPLDFKVLGSTRTPGAWFIEGVYTTKATREKLRIYIRLRVSEGTWKVLEFLIEESDE